MARIVPFPAAILFFNFIITFAQHHFTASKPPGLSLKLIHRDSPESPLYPGNLTKLERIRRMIKFSKVRAAYLGSFSTQNATLDLADRISVPIFPHHLFVWLVEVAIGTPPKSVFLEMDTGGGLVWAQCEPCKSCYRQIYPLYNSLASSTYRKLPCSHPFCRGEDNLYKCVNQECIYKVTYGDGSSTKGVASLETFRFLHNGSSGTTVDNIIFGCSNDNQSYKFTESGAIAGIMGLSFSPDSLPSQLYHLIDNRFSYCLVPFVDDKPAYLKFGNDIPPPSENMQTTKFITPPGFSLFYLNLKDISVGFHRLGLPRNIFTIRQDGGGFFIDSGCEINYIDETTAGLFGLNAYRAVMGAFQNYYDFLKLQRMGEVPEGFELCYKNPQRFNQFASMTYHFEDASYTVEGKYVNYYNYEEGYFCIAIVPARGRNILGAWYQQNMRIIYNRNINALQFYSENCANDTHP